MIFLVGSIASVHPGPQVGSVHPGPGFGSSGSGVFVGMAPSDQSGARRLAACRAEFVPRLADVG